MRQMKGETRWLTFVVLATTFVQVSIQTKQINCQTVASVGQQTIKRQESRQLASNESQLVVSANERRVQESSLQAEESRQEGPLSVVPAPGSLESSSRPQDGSQTRTTARSLLYRNGSGNSYMLISRDGSNRYQFGFDTTSSERGPKEGASEQAKRSPRLMREESRLEDGTVIGRYGYTDPFNVFRIVQYVAGADGYFAAEDVGAMMEDGVTGKPAKFQLNKQLHRALEQARARRLARANKSPAQLQTGSQAPETLAASASHQSVQYSTQINHLVGANGATFATAFRPVKANREEATRWREGAASPKQARAYEPVRSPRPIEALQRQHEQYEQLRSKLPAPIYKPNSAATFSFSIADHPAPPVSSPAPLVHATGALEQVAPKTAELLVSDEQQQRAPSGLLSQPSRAQWPPMEVLQASPAWSVLDNNYKGQQEQESSLLIDHNSGGGARLERLGGRIEANFNHEAALLRSLQKERGHFGMAYDYRSDDQAANAKGEQQARSQVAASSPGVGEFGARTRHWPTEPAAEPAVYNYGLALKQFNPPLYHPDMHETRPVDLVDTASKPAVYSSTVFHSEIAAEQSYRPERVSAAQVERRSGEESMQRSASESQPANGALEFSAKSRAQASPIFGAERSGSNQLVKSVKVLTPPGGNKTLSGESVGTKGVKIGGAQAEPIKYATRLSRPSNSRGKFSNVEREEDLHMEDSEQVAYLSSTNGTLSRAKFPDRTKKLSSILKQRAQQNSTDDASSLDGTKIRRPIPVNMKKQFQRQRPEQQASVAQQSQEQATTEQTRGESSTDTNRMSFSEETAVAANGGKEKPSKLVVGAKKFGKGLNVIEKQPVGLEEPAELEPVSAKRRPLLREQKKSEASIEVSSSPVPAPLPPPLPPTTPEQIQVQAESATTDKPADRVSSTKLTSIEESPTVASTKIIDATDTEGAAKSSLDKDLFEKILRIQQEIAAMSSTSTTSTSTEAPQTSTTGARTTSLPPETTTSSQQPSTLALSNNSTTFAVKVGQDEVVSSSSFPSTQTSSTEMKKVFGPESEQQEQLPLDPESKGNDRNFLTGPIISMDGMMDQSAFMDKLSQDMDTFDSVRALSYDLTTTSTTTTSTTPSPVIAADETLSSTAPPSPTSQIAEATTPSPAPSILLQPTTAQTQVSGLQLIASSKQPDISDGASQSSVLDLAQSTGHQVQANSSSESSKTVPSTTVGPTKNQTHAGEATNGSKIAPQAETISTLPSTTVNPISLPQTTTAKMTTTTTTNGTSAALKAPISPTIRPPARRSTAAPRFGRLVIKRGDKVVARFNASEPIPDSMIPVGGNNTGEIIMPDMPRLGMRRGIKRRLNVGANGANSVNKTVMSTERETAVIASRGQNRTAPTGGQGEVRDDLLLAEASRVSLVRKSLFREPRSYLHQAHLNGALSEVPSEADLMVAESREPPTTRLELESLKAPAVGANETDQSGASNSSSNNQPELADRSRSVSDRSTTVRSNSGSKPSGRAGGRNWSSRLRDHAGRLPLSNKTYNAREDLEKLVEKIATIERSEAKRRPQSKQATNRFTDRGRSKQDKIAIRAPSVNSDNSNNIEIRRPTNSTLAAGQTKRSETNVTAEATKPTLPVIGESANLTRETKAETGAGNETGGILMSLVRLDFNASELPEAQAFGSVNSQLIKVLSNRTDERAAVMVGEQRVAGANGLAKQGASTGEAKQNLPPQTGRAKPDERPTGKPGPVNGSAELEGRSSTRTVSVESFAGKGEASRALESHGHIHVRNNQSLSVHVDIEPPERAVDSRPRLNSSSLAPGQKRLVSRDTTTVRRESGVFGKDDIQRVARPRIAERNPAIDVNNVPRLWLQEQQQQQVDLQSAGQATVQSRAPESGVATLGTNVAAPTAARTKRKPHMLCIEVQSGPE